jgi:predicted metal-dependent HD superfamily phosphohydrolase
MSAREAVQRCWTGLARRHGIASSAAQPVLDELLGAYAEPHRAYHTLDHIAALLQLLEVHGKDATDRDALELAILLHDIVYDPERTDNEAASAHLARERLAALGYPEATTTKVARYILATQHDTGTEAAAADTDLALLLDLDLSALAAEPEAYLAYAQAIRREYAHYRDEVYRAGRRRVLEGFLARERIYFTGRLRALWEARARANLAGEVAALARDTGSAPSPPRP